MKRQGKLILVGAGPGDSGLLTRRGEKALRQAQVVLADRLVGAEILALVPPEAEVLDVGKQRGNHPIPQQEINRLLLQKAGEGKVVVRLKGGDPYLFGRGAEELEAALEAGIPIEVIPGITASIAVPAWAGIPVTHRDHSSSLHILTGHAKDGAAPKLDYDSLVKMGGTLVFMMGFTAMKEILTGLEKAGMPPEMPAALIQEGTLPTQRRLVATVGTLPEKAKESGMRPPAVLVVGKVCALADKLDWHSRKPLNGKTILVTRPHTAGGELAEKLAELGGGVIQFPCIHLKGRDGLKLPRLDTYNWIVFTSAFGAELFFRQLQAEGLDIRSLAGIKFAAIGSRTAKELEKRCVKPEYVPDIYDARHLAQGLKGLVGKEEKVLLFRAAMGTPELPEILEKAGISYTDLPAYDTLYENHAAARIAEKLEQGTIDYVTFTSASTVEGFVGAVGKRAAAAGSFTGLCIGRQTAEKAEQYGIYTLVSQQATVDSMVAAILQNERKCVQ